MLKLILILVVVIFVVIPFAYIRSRQKIDIKEFVIFDFQNSSEVSDFDCVNDDVIGGLSESTFSYNSDSESSIFSGNLKPKDGVMPFASIQSYDRHYTLEKYAGLFIEYKGDDNDYQVIFCFDDESYFTADFTAFRNEHRQRIEIPFEDFRKEIAGAVSAEHTLDLSQYIQSVGIMHKNINATEFELELFKIGAYKENKAEIEVSEA